MIQKYARIKNKKFHIRNKMDNAIINDIQTLPYTLMHMSGNFQQEFTHEISIERKITECRIFFTFRKHLV